MRIRVVPICLVVALGISGRVSADQIPLVNWAVPQPHGIQALGDVTFPGVFVGLSPCRIVDTRGGAPLGGGALAASTPRNYTLTGNCGLPSGSAAASLNITVTNTAGSGYVSIWPQGGTQPVVSTLNFTAGQTIANAAVVPLSGSGGVSVACMNAGCDLIVDTNGYYLSNTTTMNSGEYLGITGNATGYCGLLYVSNATTDTSACDSAINAYMSGAPNGSVIIGTQGNTAGTNYAVKGVNSNPNNTSAAVLGVLGSATSVTTYWAAGVRGESTTKNGVLGFSVAAGSFSVGGIRVDNTGTMLRQGVLGGDTSGVEYTGGLSGSGTKSFLEPHPTDATKMIDYVALEGPEAGTYFRGRGRFVGGTATIQVPESFRMVTDPDGITVQVTPIGRATAVGVVRIGLDSIDVEATHDVEFSYLVQGVRKAYKDIQAIVPNTFFRPKSPDDRMPVSLSADEKQRLIDNGTYNPDGTVNMATAERLGWAREWRERDAASRNAAEQAAAASQFENSVQH